LLEPEAICLLPKRHPLSRDGGAPLFWISSAWDYTDPDRSRDLCSPRDRQ
jgi:hypothetical protein